MMLLVLALAATLQAGVVESVIVHGNHTTPTSDVLALAGDLIGREATDALITEVSRRLELSGRFAGVDVRRRQLSLDDDSRILLVIVVDEREGVSPDDLTPGPLKRLGASSMWLPVLEYQEGYGFTYGARVSVVDRLGARSRVSVPLTWGGRREAALEIERGFAHRGVSRVIGGGGIERRENPHYEIGDTRTFVRGRAESAPWPVLRVGGGGSGAGVRFGGIEDTLTSVGVDVALDTRRDPAMPRNAVFVQAGIERLGYDASSVPDSKGGSGPASARRLSLDAHGYLGLIGQTVLSLRAQSVTTSEPVPVFEQQLLGGIPSLRGYDVGTRADDNLAAVSAELVVPLTAPLNLAHAGIKVFMDGGTVYGAGTPLADQRLEWGYGAGVFVNATIFTLGVDLGWREGRGVPNAHVQLGVHLSR